jgi:hypothetical protein
MRATQKLWGRKPTFGCLVIVAPYPSSGLANEDVAFPFKVSTFAEKIKRILK